MESDYILKNELVLIKESTINHRVHVSRIKRVEPRALRTHPKLHGSLCTRLPCVRYSGQTLPNWCQRATSSGGGIWLTMPPSTGSIIFGPPAQAVCSARACVQSPESRLTQSLLPPPIAPRSPPFQFFSGACPSMPQVLWRAPCWLLTSRG